LTDGYVWTRCLNAIGWNRDQEWSNGSVATYNNAGPPIAGMVARFWPRSENEAMRVPSRRQPPAKTTTVSTEAAALEETPTVLAPRQVSPQVSAALLSKFRTDLTPEQAEIVDPFKQQCPGFAVMRKLVLNFRSLLRMGKLDALHRWMKCAQKTGIHALTRFVRTLQQDLRAVEAAEQRTGRGTH
jgi:hypothetical protein